MKSTNQNHQTAQNNSDNINRRLVLTVLANGMVLSREDSLSPDPDTLYELNPLH